MEHSPCRATPVDFQPPPFPTKHLHIDQDLKLSLFNKSEVLWSLLTLNTKLPGSSDENIVLASDPRLPSSVLGRGQGAFSPLLYPVRIPAAHRFTEALILLLIRDRFHLYECFWMAMLLDMLEYVDETEILREDDLEPSFRPFFHALKTEGSAPYQILDELGKTLKSETA